MDLIINSSFLRELDLSKFLRYFACYEFISDEMLKDDLALEDAIKDICDWDRTGHDGLALYCGHFESIKRNDLEFLIKYIKDNSDKLKEIVEERGSEKREQILREKLDKEALKIRKLKDYYNSDNYKVNKSSKKTIYKGREYDSRRECIIKEGITKAELYKYLVEQNPEEFVELRKKYKL